MKQWYSILKSGSSVPESILIDLFNINKCMYFICRDKLYRYMNLSYMIKLNDREWQILYIHAYKMSSLWSCSKMSIYPIIQYTNL